MSLTEQALIEVFDQKEIPISQRVLTDWRRKHYLPPLQSRGLGRGQGKIYFWTEADIIERAVLVDELLNIGFKGTRINMVLWLLGYDMPLYLVRERLQTGIEKFERQMTGGNSSGGEVEDYISQFVFNYYRLAERLNRQFPDLQLPTNRRPEEMEMFMNLLSNSVYSLYDTPFEEGARAALERSRSGAGEQSEGDGEVKPAKTEEELRLQWDFFRQYFSLTKLKTALLWAGDGELLKARADVSGIFKSLGELLSGMPEAEALKPIRLHAAYTLGSVMILVDLSLRHSGLGLLIELGLTKLHEHLAEQRRRLASQEEAVVTSMPASSSASHQPAGGEIDA